MVISWDLTCKNGDFMGFNHQQCQVDDFLKGKPTVKLEINVANTNQELGGVI